MFIEIIVRYVSANLRCNCFFRISERKGKSEIDLRLLKLAGSAPRFLRIGVTVADLSTDGTVPMVREE